MPYSGIEPGSALERKVESCVEQVLAKHKGEKGFGKSNAIAICRSRLEAGLGRMGGPEAGGPGGQCVCPKCGAKASHDTGEPCSEMTCPKCGAKMTRQAVKGGLSLEPVTAGDLEEYGNHALFAQAKGTMLKFKGADLCSIGRNKNGDWIDKTGLEELAATMSFLPIDDEHNQRVITGFFVNPRTVGDKLFTDGIIYAERFPEIAAQVQNGLKKLSIEAVAQKAVCSVCGGEFTSVKEYCEHLMDKETHGAIRKLYGLRAKGGATVFHPAWDTSFDANGFVMIASQVEFETKEVEVETPKWVINLIAKIEGLVSRLKPVMLEVTENDQTKGGVQMSEVNVDELNLEELGLVQASELDTLKADLEAKLAEKETDIEKLKIGFARALEMSMEASQLEILADMSEDAYQLLKAQQEKPKEEVKIEAKKEEEPEPKEKTVLEGGVIEPDVPLTWETAPSVLKLKKEV